MALPPKYRFICVKLRRSMDTDGDDAISIAEWRAYWQSERDSEDGIDDQLMWFKAIAIKAIKGKGGDASHLIPKVGSKWALPGKPPGKPHHQPRSAGVPPAAATKTRSRSPSISRRRTGLGATHEESVRIHAGDLADISEGK
jgi:hypothetical protein